MAIFGVLKSEPTVQVSDKTRLDATRSFVSKDEAAITLVEIQPSAADSFIDVTGSSSDDWFLDWAYSTDGTAVVTLRITTDGAPSSFTASVVVETVANDNLFSSDSDLLKYEADLYDFLPAGYSSFNWMHRKAKQLILDWFNEQGYRLSDNTKITQDEIVDLDEVRRWSETWVLAMIFSDASNSIDDKFSEKSNFYMSKSLDARNRSVFQLDLDQDGTVDTREGVRVQSVRLNRQ